MKEEKEFLKKVVDLLEGMKSELQIKEQKCNEGKMLIRIGHRISAIQKVKHYVKQRIKGDDIPEITGKGNSNPILYYKRPE
jgi:hypothetical protein|tara:strand:+ start:372 stop:614 length:243 start_codon:yes stop_codon:yes gene_type:complete